MSIDARKKSKRGRPAVDSEEIRARVGRSLLVAIALWIAKHPEPKPTRPEAIRLLLSKALEDEQI